MKNSNKCNSTTQNSALFFNTYKHGNYHMRKNRLGKLFTSRSAISFTKRSCITSLTTQTDSVFEYPNWPYLKINALIFLINAMEM